MIIGSQNLNPYLDAFGLFSRISFGDNYRSSFIEKGDAEIHEDKKKSTIIYTGEIFVSGIIADSVSILSKIYSEQT